MHYFAKCTPRAHKVPNVTSVVIKHLYTMGHDATLQAIAIEYSGYVQCRLGNSVRLWATGHYCVVSTRASSHKLTTKPKCQQASKVAPNAWSVSPASRSWSPCADYAPPSRSKSIYLRQNNMAVRYKKTIVKLKQFLHCAASTRVCL